MFRNHEELTCDEMAPVDASMSVDLPPAPVDAEPLSAEALAARLGKAAVLDHDDLNDVRSPLDNDQLSSGGSSSGGTSSGLWNRDSDEPMLQDNEDRFCLFPIKEDAVWRMYKQAEASFWTAEEIDLSMDYRDWQVLSENEQHFISHVLAFFAASDGIVLENLGLRFLKEVQMPEARAFYAFQLAIENIHRRRTACCWTRTLRTA